MDRARFLLERGNIPVVREQEVVSTLRNVVGFLSDLTEQFGFKPQPKASGAPKPEESKGPPGGEVSATPKPVSEEASESKKDPKKEEKVEVLDKEAEGAKKSEKEKVVAEKAEKKKDNKKEKKSKSNSGGKDTPKRKPEEKEPSEVKKSKTSASSRGRTDRGGADEGVRLQAVVDRYVSSHPSSFGLESIPVRGSAGRHIVDRETRGRERPPEPEGPPPRRGQPRDRSRSRKKSKGAKHRERGKQFWRSVRQRDHWRRR